MSEKQYVDFYEAIKQVMNGKSMRIVSWHKAARIKLVPHGNDKVVNFVFYGKSFVYQIKFKDVNKKWWEEFKELHNDI